MPRGPKTTWKQAAVLAALGTLAGLAALELGMRAAGAFLSRRASALTGRDSAGLVVLCLGESTTAPTLPEDHSWPEQLAGILNAAGAGRFTVVNEGLTGARSDELLAAIPGLLALHRPSVVVGMFGVNDAQWYGLAEAAAPSRLPPAVRSLRLYKLACYALEELVYRTKPRTGEEGAQNQRAIARAVVDAGVPLVLMQYPGLDVGDLKARFDAFAGRVEFVDTKASFDRARAKAGYEDLFTDRFAGDWGHCTAAGDALIAAGAARAVLALGLRRAADSARPAPAYIARGRARTDLSPADVPREKARQLEDFRRGPTLDNLGRLLALDRGARALTPADRRLARAALAREAGARGSAEALSRAAPLYEALGDDDDAFTALGRLAAARPDDPDPQLRRAQLALRLERRAAALEALAAADKLATDAPRRRRVALGYQDLGRYRQAADLLEQLAADDPRSAQLQTDLGVCRSLAGDRAAAEAAFARALALDPSYAPARRSLDALKK